MQKLNTITLIKLTLTGALTFVVTFAATAFLGVNLAQAASPTCYDITGSTLTPVTVGGIANTGIIYFDPPNTPAYQYEACVEDPKSGLGLAAGETAGPFLVKGWSWDDNIGWISFYCGDEDSNVATPYTNLGVTCGTQVYGVTMEGNTTTGGRIKGELNGYAWADNGGYINFNGIFGGVPLNTYSVIVQVTGACTGLVYGTVVPPSSTCTAHINDKDYLYAWSDNLGWFNFYGVKFPWVDLIGIGVAVKVQITPDPLIAGYVPPYGNNLDDYKVDIVLTKSTPGPVTAIDPAQYVVTAALDWTDTVGTNQIDGVVSAGSDAIVGLPTFFSMNGIGGPDIYDAVNMRLRKSFTSLAPTSAMNVSGINNYSNQAFILPTGMPVEPVNSLTFNDIKLQIVHLGDNICIFGDFGTCGQIPIISGYEGKNLEFKPAISLDTFDDSINRDFISLRNLVSAAIQAVLADHCNAACAGAKAAVTLGLKGTNFKLVYDDDDSTSEEAGFDKNDPTSFDLTAFGSYPSLPIGPVCTLAGGCPAFDSDSYAYSVISYILGGKSVQYYGNKLPRVKGSLVVNPVAKVVGSVYSTGVTNPQSGTAVRSLGDVSTNILRDTIFRNISNIIAGVSAPLSGATINNFVSNSSGFWVNPSLSYVKKLLPDATTPFTPRVYYFTGDLTIGDLVDIGALTGERTIVTIGGNIFIKKNLYTPAGALSRPRLGIIAFKDLATGEGGNIYIAPDVTNIQANIYADGSVFSYDGNSANINAAGEPIFTDEADRYSKLKNQLYIEGSIASQNTIGGAVATPKPILGDGSTTSAAEGTYGNAPFGRAQARLYDLNFLRYYGWAFGRMPATSGCPGDAVDQQNPTICSSDPLYSLSATPITEGGDLVLIEGGIAAKPFDVDEATKQANASSVLITFDPPPSTLPGFGVTTGAEVQFRPQ